MTYYFYDLETSGLQPGQDRIMQFAGQRLDDRLQPLGDVCQFLIKLSDDIIPNPEAILIHRITPQESRLEGVSEPQFLKWLHKNVLWPETILVGYGSMEFDDDFLRFLHYRNFYDWTSWPGQTWDIYRALRLTRDLHPEGINWPKVNGQASLKLRDLTRANRIAHHQVHSAEGDTLATVEVARLLKDRQPDFYNRLLEICLAGEDRQLATSGQPFVYSGFYQPSAGPLTTVATAIAEDAGFPNDLIVYDLRYDPKAYADKSTNEILSLIKNRHQPSPWRRLRLDRQPLVGRLESLTAASWQRLGLNKATVKAHHQLLLDSGLAQRLPNFFSPPPAPSRLDVDRRLPSQPLPEADRALADQVRQAGPGSLQELTSLRFQSPGLNQLLTLYCARNFPGLLTSAQLSDWEGYKRRKFFGGQPSRLDTFGSQLQKLAQTHQSDPGKINLLLELQLYVQSILPVND